MPSPFASNCSLNPLGGILPNRYCNSALVQIKITCFQTDLCEREHYLRIGSNALKGKKRERDRRGAPAVKIY